MVMMEQEPLPNENENEGQAQPESRLMITKMVLENFKSYAGVKEIGPFHKCFSSVVGPNGSGKSNVIDAMLFVFGKRAKKLRLNKVSELIHSSDAFKNNPLKFAKVSVHFQEIVDTGDGDEDYKVVPSSEIIVSRTALRNNSSSYKLNGKTCKFKDVATYLDSKGINLDNNRFLILQGEVEMISMMAPKGKNENDEGLLEYLEDIIGSNQFVEETNQAAENVDLLTEQRQERLNRVKAVEAEKENLEGAKLEAEALLAKEREIRKKKNILLQIYSCEVDKEIEVEGERRKIHEEALEEERLKLQEANVKVAQFEESLEEDTNEYALLRKEMLRTKEEFSAHERRHIKLNEDIKHGKESLKKIQTKIESEQNKITNIEEKVEKAEENIPILEEEIEEFTENKASEDEKLEKIYEEIKVETDSLRPVLEEKKRNLAPIERERAVYQSSLDTAIMEVKLLEDSTARAKEQLHAAEKELNSLDDVQEAKRIRYEECKEEVKHAEQRIIDANAEEVSLTEKENALTEKYSELTALVEESKAAMQATSRSSPTVQKILQATKKGGPLSKVGVLGRLGDLARIDEQFDVAVSTACSMLDYIVVETTLGAQQCLAFLRKQNLGRANFIPLDKMKKGIHNHNVETPEGAPRLFDMITPSNYDVVPALFLAVKNTLVAPDLETASRWAYEYSKRWRVVTVDGKLIEIAGTMSGGGKSVRKGGMRLINKKIKSSGSAENNESEEDYERLKQQSKQALEFLQHIRSRRRELADEVKRLEKKVKTLKVELPKLEVEIDGCDTSREELTSRIPELKEQSKMSSDDTKKLRHLNINVQKCKSDMAACVSKASKLEAEVAKLQKAILDAGGASLKKQQRACDKIEKKLNNAKTELNEAQVTLKSSKTAMKKATKAKENATLEFERNDSKLNKLTEEFNLLASNMERAKEAFENAKIVESEKKQYLDDVNEENEELIKSQSKSKCAEADLLAKIESVDKAIKSLEKQSLYFEDEINKLHKAEVQDDEYDYSDDEEDEEESEMNLDDKGEVGNNTEEGDSDEIKEKEKSGNKPTQATSRQNQSSLPLLPLSALEQYDEKGIKESIQILEEEKEVMASNANMTAIAEYRKKEADYLARVGELDEITELRNEARKTHEELRNKRLAMFMEGFAKITLKLKEMYQMITLGGDAELELVDSLDPFSEGIVFSVRPPKKSWKNIANLSGGEKTLSSLALVFALHHYKPTPLYVMDEIDAALDFKNVSIVANYIKERTKNAQFIIISLRNNMFELADRLVGIYKTNNCTKSVSIDPRQFGIKGKMRTKAKSPLADTTNIGSL